MRRLVFLTSLIAAAFILTPAMAGEPGGSYWFQLITQTVTSLNNDATGDGGTGDYNDLNYYYVGQNFNTRIQIGVNTTTPGSSAADIIIYYPTTTISVSSAPQTGTFFDSWSGQGLDTEEGELLSTGYNNAGNQSTGADGTFGYARFYTNVPSAADYGTSTPAMIDIEFTGVGSTTDSNISYAGYDYMDSVEDFYLHIWADTVKPYGLNPSPGNAASGITVESNYTFDLCDSKDGEAGDGGTCLASGVGTGVSVATPPGVITFDDGDGPVSYTAYDSYSCSGIWGTNECGATVNPPSPLGIGGDQRNWKYDTTYTVTISGFQDNASSNQDQLGDPNGPNTMDPKVWTFTTEADTVPPQVSYRNPSAGQTGVSVDTNVVVSVVDKETLGGSISGTGVNSSTCRLRIYSNSFASTTYQLGDANVSVSAISYGYQFTINPSTNFAQNETVYVSVYGCADLASTPNVMVTDNYSFSTADTDPPYVDQQNPANDASIATTGTISFHIKDDGSGVDLSNTVIYVNGVYYTDGGGAGSVTTNGTRITYASSLDFNGSNYLGDTSAITGGVNDYTFVLDPEADFSSGEAVVVAIYTKDTSGNIMERELYAAVVGAGASQTCGNGSIEGNEVCDDGNTNSGDGCRNDCLSDESCGNSIYDSGEECDDGNTTSGDGCSASCQFEDSGGTTVCPSCPTSGGGGVNTLGVQNASAQQIDETTIMITWNTNMAATTRVVYGDEPAPEYGSAPNYTYPYSTEEVDSKTMFHSVIISDLKPGQMYYFKPISTTGAGLDVVGEEIRMTPLFAQKIVETIQYIEVPGECALPVSYPSCPGKDVLCKGMVPIGTQGGVSTGAEGSQAGGGGIMSEISIIKINDKAVDAFIYDNFGIKYIEVDSNRDISFYGTGVPNTRFTLTIY